MHQQLIWCLGVSDVCRDIRLVPAHINCTRCAADCWAEGHAASKHSHTSSYLFFLFVCFARFNGPRVLCFGCASATLRGKMYSTLNSSTPGDSNLSAADPERLQELTHRSLKVSIIIVLGVMITLGNVAVLLVITSSVAGWSRNSRYFLLSLTAADSAFGLLVMPLNLWVSLLKDYTEGPDALCHVVAFCNATVYSTCMYTLATISLERYIAVFYPLQYSSLMTRKRTLLLIAFAWCFPPFLLSPISFPGGIIEVNFSTASLVCNPSYSTNVGYSLSLTCFIFFPCSIIMTYANLRVWCAAKRQRLKLRKYACARSSRHNVASRVLVPVMAAYYTCWTPCMATMIYNGKQWNIVYKVLGGGWTGPANLQMGLFMLLVVVVFSFSHPTLNNK